MPGALLNLAASTIPSCHTRHGIQQASIATLILLCGGRDSEDALTHAWLCVGCRLISKVCTGLCVQEAVTHAVDVS